MYICPNTGERNGNTKSSRLECSAINLNDMVLQWVRVPDVLYLLLGTQNFLVPVPGLLFFRSYFHFVCCVLFQQFFPYHFIFVLLFRFVSFRCVLFCCYFVFRHLLSAFNVYSPCRLSCVFYIICIWIYMDTYLFCFQFCCVPY